MREGLNIETTAVISLSEAFERFAETCRQIAHKFRDFNEKYGGYMKRRHLHRPVQRLDKNRKRHGRT